MTLPLGRFEGRMAFQQAVRDAFATAATEGWREIVVVDASFEDWPLGERAVAQSLSDWSRNGRRFLMLARHYDELPRRHARFVTWRRTWSHIIECWQCPSADALDFPGWVLSTGWVMQRVDPVRSVCVAGHEPERRLALRETLDEWLRKSSPGFPATTLGL